MTHDTRYRVRNRDAGHGTALEDPLGDGRNPAWYDDVGQAAARRERVTTQAGEAIRDPHSRQADAASERVTFDGGDLIRDCNGG